MVDINFTVAVDPPGAFDARDVDLITKKDMLQLGQSIVALVRIRTLQGLDKRGTPFRPYSRRPLYVAKKRARLAPKGGRPTKSGKSVFYAGGYAEYKRTSRRLSVPTDGSATAEVDLILSGQLMGSLHVSRATPTSVRISTGAREALYGIHVNSVRRFMGISRKEREGFAKDLEGIAEKRLAAAFGRGVRGGFAGGARPGLPLGTGVS